METLRYNLEDKGQDLLYIHVNVNDDGVGKIVDMSSVPYKDHYLNKEFNKYDNLVGDYFNYIEPSGGAQVRQSIKLKYRIDSIQIVIRGTLIK